MIALAATNPAPTPLTWRRALRDLDLAHDAAAAAHRAFLDCPFGDTEELLRRSAAWRATEAEVARAALRERAERFKANGRSWLKKVHRGA